MSQTQTRPKNTAFGGLAPPGGHGLSSPGPPGGLGRPHGMSLPVMASTSGVLRPSPTCPSHSLTRYRPPSNKPARKKKPKKDLAEKKEMKKNVPWYCQSILMSAAPPSLPSVTIGASLSGDPRMPPTPPQPRAATRGASRSLPSIRLSSFLVPPGHGALPPPPDSEPDEEQRPWRQKPKEDPPVGQMRVSEAVESIPIGGMNIPTMRGDSIWSLPPDVLDMKWLALSPTSPGFSTKEDVWRAKVGTFWETAPSSKPAWMLYSGL